MKRTFRRWLVSVSLLFFVGSAFSPPADAGELTLALANSTCEAMNKVEDLYRANHSTQFINICKSSGLLAKGLNGGALSADLFISADREWMDFVVEKGLVAQDRVSSPWGNALVVASPRSGSIQRLDWQDLATDKVSIILIGDPSTAPFGRYAKEALEASGLWDRVKSKIQTRKNIELLAESLATSGASTVGILFKTNLTDQLRPLMTVNKNWHKPIRYYMAPLKAAEGKAEVTEFLRFMKSQAVKGVFESEGYDVSAP